MAAPGGTSASINYYNREEAFLAEDSQRLGETTFSIEEKAYAEENALVYLDDLLRVGAINLSEHKRLLANSKNTNGTYWKTVFTRLYGTIPGPSGGEKEPL